MKDIYIGYFICPACNTKNMISSWKIKEDEDVTIVFKPLKTTRMYFWCICGAKWEFGIEKQRGR